jgi:hypothetical protein
LNEKSKIAAILTEKANPAPAAATSAKARREAGAQILSGRRRTRRNFAANISQMISSRSCATRKRCSARASLKSANRTATPIRAAQAARAAKLRHQLFHLGQTELQHAAIIANIERESFLPRNHRARPRLGHQFFRPFAICKQKKFLPPDSEPLPQQHRGQRGHVAERPRAQSGQCACARFADAGQLAEITRRQKFFFPPCAHFQKPGFAASVASFASQREFANPPDKFKPTSRKTVALNSRQRAAPSASADKSKKPSSMETGTTNGEKRFITANIRAEIIAVSVRPRGANDQLRAQSPRRKTRHAVFNAKLLRAAVRRQNKTVLPTTTGNNQRATAQRWRQNFLARREEIIGVHMEDARRFHQ